MLILTILSVFMVQLVITASSLQAVSAPEGFTHSLELDPGVYTLYWKFDDDSVTFEIHVESLGYVGFGISPNGGMTGSDVIIAWVQDDQTWFAVSVHNLF